MGLYGYFKSVLAMSIFWSLALTLLFYAVPGDKWTTLQSFQSSQTPDLNYMTSKVQGSVTSQLNAPSGTGAIDLALLTLYSGNVFIDMLRNFIFAFPGLLTVLFGGIFMLFPMNAFIQSKLLEVINTFLSIIYLLGIIMMLLNIRRGSGEIG